MFNITNNTELDKKDLINGLYNVPTSNIGTSNSTVSIIGNSTSQPKSAPQKPKPVSPVSQIQAPKNLSIYSSLTNLKNGLSNLSTTLGKLKPEPINVNAMAKEMPPAPPVSKIDDVQTGLQSQFATLKEQLEKQYQTQIDALQNQINTQKEQAQAYQQKEENALSQYKEKATSPLASTITQGNDFYKVNENYFANQSLLGELESIMNEMNTSSLRDSELLASGAVSKSEINRRKQYLTARAGTIEAVLNARNNQIGTAMNIIDRTYNALKEDKANELNYYSNLVKYYDELRQEKGNTVLALNKDQRRYIDAKINQKQEELNNLDKSVEYIKNLMINPETAQVIADAGVNLTDTIPEINSKLAKWSKVNEIKTVISEMMKRGYSEILPSEKDNYPSYDIVRWTDSNKVTHYFVKQNNELGEMLTPTQAKSWNVPYGTTKAQLVGRTAPSTSGGDKPLSAYEIVAMNNLGYRAQPGDTLNDVLNRHEQESGQTAFERLRASLEEKKKEGYTYDDIMEGVIRQYNAKAKGSETVTTYKEFAKHNPTTFKIINEVYGMGKVKRFIHNYNK